MKKVFGVYDNRHEARQALKVLLENGYKKEEITVISNKKFFDKDLDENLHEEDERNLWEKIKDAFSFDEYHDDYWVREVLEEQDRILLEPYKENLNSGGVIIIVEEFDQVDLEIPMGHREVNYDSNPLDRNRKENDPNLGADHGSKTL